MSTQAIPQSLSNPNSDCLSFDRILALGMASSRRFDRVCILILDSLGVGEMNDAQTYGDQGSNTLKHLEDHYGPLKIPNLAALGLVKAGGLQKTLSPSTGRAFYSRMKELSKGKDTTTGHWEMMGMPLFEGLSLFPNGFPKKILDEFKKRTGLDYIGNKPASGTVIIDELGAEHLKTQKAIVYTSADSVFQIAWHEEKFGLERLYEICEISRKILDESEFKVGRVIARPFIGEPGHFKRTGNRRDFSLAPWMPSALDYAKERGLSVSGVGKIPYIYNFKGITNAIEAHNDTEAIDATVATLKSQPQAGIIFTNLNDLDMVYGHRRNLKGYAEQLEAIDRRLPEILKELKANDLLLIAADHGNDPSFKGTDHTREFVPLLIHSPSFSESHFDSRRLEDREAFADMGQTICENFDLRPLHYGESFLEELQ